MIDRTYRNDPYEYMSQDPCDYCPYKNTDKCMEYRKERRRMINYNELRDGQEFYANGYKKGYEDALNNYSEWLKNQRVGLDYNKCEVLVDRNGIWESAIETYLKERSSEE